MEVMSTTYDVTGKARLGRALSFADATEYFQKHPELFHKKYCNALATYEKILLVGRGLTSKGYNGRTAMSVLAVWKNKEGKYTCRVLRQWLFYNPAVRHADFFHYIGRGWFLACGSYGSILYPSLQLLEPLHGDFEFCELCGDKEELRHVKAFAAVDENLAINGGLDGSWIIVSTYMVYRLERRRGEFHVTMLWEKERLGEGLRAIARIPGGYLVGGDKPMGLFILRENSDGVYYVDREIGGFDGMIWAIAEIGENAWLIGGDNELRMLTLTNDEFILSDEIDGFRGKRIRAIHEISDSAAIVGGEHFCYIVEIYVLLDSFTCLCKNSRTYLCKNG